MQPPISVGHTLQNRYKIQRILGQGGFGRTYLAEDTRRFNELCAIKELIPVTTEVGAWDKARELFQREAAILYQIQHPQVPQFRERFEEDQRLFLVQDYVPGKTYRTLLDERLLEGKTFSEQEVIQLMRLLLPVLEHIHNHHIIHRDISPENIIYRDRDGLPVLIDFGVVKELATKLQSPTQVRNATAVGKLGYAPSEQMQTGRAYASSDLYSLAVTALVLLTGKEPQDLYDETNATWKWGDYASVNPRFGQILNRMLSYIPSDRYQTAPQVAQLLASLNLAPPPPPFQQETPSSNSANNPKSNANLSNLQTVAVGARPDPTPPSNPRNIPPSPTSESSAPPVINPPVINNHKSILDSPLAVGAIGAAVVLLAGFGSWAIVSSIRNSQRFPNQASVTTSPQTFPSPVISKTETPTPTPTTTEPSVFSKRLTFDTSGIARAQGQLTANQTIQYTFQGQEGEELIATVAEVGSIALTILAPNGQPIDAASRQVASYQGVLPFTGKYTIQVSPILGVTESPYNLSVSLQKPAQVTPSSAPIEPTPIIEPQPTETPRGRTPETIPTTRPERSRDRPIQATPTPTSTPRTQPGSGDDIVIPVEPSLEQTPSSGEGETPR